MLRAEKGIRTGAPVPRPLPRIGRSSTRGDRVPAARVRSRWLARRAAGVAAGRSRRTEPRDGRHLAQLGQLDPAFEPLDLMIRARRVMIVHMDSEPRLDPLRADPQI